MRVLRAIGKSPRLVHDTGSINLLVEIHITQCHLIKERKKERIKERKNKRKCVSEGVNEGVLENVC